MNLMAGVIKSYKIMYPPPKQLSCKSQIQHALFLSDSSVKLNSNVGHKSQNLYLDRQVAVTGWKQNAHILVSFFFLFLGSFDSLAFSETLATNYRSL